MPDQNLHEITSKKRLILPIGERTYEVPRASGRLWLELQNQQREVETRLAAGKSLPEVAAEIGGNDADLWRKALGADLFERMLDELDADQLVIAGNTAFLWQLGHGVAADLYWTSGGRRSAAASPPAEDLPEPSTAEG